MNHTPKKYSFLNSDNLHYEFNPTINQWKLLEMTKENKAFLVTAVNAHEELVNALKVLIDHAKETYPHFESERGQRDIKAGIEALTKAGVKL
jgi:hypothetical protein